MDRQLAETLFRKYLDGQGTPAEMGLLMDWLERPENEHLEKEWVSLQLMHELRPAGYSDAVLEQQLTQKLGDILARIPGEKTSGRARVIPAFTRRAAAAAVILLLAASAGYMLLSRGGAAPVASIHSRPAAAPKNDIAPGGNKAILTLGNGGQIVLDTSATGVLAREGNTSIEKRSDGQLDYKTAGAQNAAIVYNTLSTPPGGQYQVVLSDGSRIWLDAASSISYPTAFSGGERRVKVTGQAYFEIAKNEKMPFVVQKGNMSIQVLGTDFNVNAYDDEATVKTTLLSGSVKVSEGSAQTILRPGQQVQVTRNGAFTLIPQADLEEAVAWKNGFFRFNHCDLPTVMRQLSRWYDVEVVYQGKIPAQQFGGKMERDLNLSEVLEGLEKSLVHFKIENKKLIVMP